MKFFNDESAALSYVACELLNTLRDDLRKMQMSEHRHYSDDDRKDMADKIADIEQLAPLIKAAPALLALARHVALYPDGDRTQWQSAIIEQAFAAIAKAR